MLGLIILIIVFIILIECVTLIFKKIKYFVQIVFSEFDECYDKKIKIKEINEEIERNKGLFKVFENQLEKKNV